MVDGVTHVEVDAAARLDLVRRLRINSTPTVLVLDPDGAIIEARHGPAPQGFDVIAALGSVDPARPRPGSRRPRAGTDRVTCPLCSTRLALHGGYNSGRGSDSPTKPA